MTIVGNRQRIIRRRNTILFGVGVGEGKHRVAQNCCADRNQGK
jgi:hypothetical protein